MEMAKENENNFFVIYHFCDFLYRRKDARTQVHCLRFRFVFSVRLRHPAHALDRLRKTLSRVLF